jgi:hypothetical protein
MPSRTNSSLIAVFAIPALLAQQGGQYPPSTNKYPPPIPKKTEITPPPAIRVCASPNDPNICGTWIWKGGYYKAWHEVGADSKVTIGSFIPGSVVLNRADAGTPGPMHPGAGFTQVYSGTISSDGESILDGQSHASDGTSGTFRAYWGNAMVVHPALTPQDWNAPESYPSKSCNPATFNGNGVEAAARGAHEVESKNYRVAACWLRLGADREDPVAEGMLAAVLYKGLGGSPSYPEAFALATRGAIQDNFIAAEVLYRMYESGQGVPKDAKMAQLWNSKIDAFKTEYNVQQQLIAQKHHLNQQLTSAQRAQQIAVTVGFLAAAVAILGAGGGSSSSSSDSRVCESGHWVSHGLDSGHSWFCDRYSN